MSLHVIECAVPTERLPRSRAFRTCSFRRTLRGLYPCAVSSFSSPHLCFLLFVLFCGLFATALVCHSFDFHLRSFFALVGASVRCVLLFVVSFCLLLLLRPVRVLTLALLPCFCPVPRLAAFSSYLPVLLALFFRRFTSLLPRTRSPRVRPFVFCSLLRARFVRARCFPLFLPPVSFASPPRACFRFLLLSALLFPASPVRACLFFSCVRLLVSFSCAVVLSFCLLVPCRRSLLSCLRRSLPLPFPATCPRLLPFARCGLRPFPRHCFLLSSLFPSSSVLDLHGEPGGTRTRDPVIKSHMLYQLSYRPSGGDTA